MRKFYNYFCLFSLIFVTLLFPINLKAGYQQIVTISKQHIVDSSGILIIHGQSYLSSSEKLNVGNNGLSSQFITASIQGVGSKMSLNWYISAKGGGFPTLEFKIPSSSNNSKLVVLISKKSDFSDSVSVFAGAYNSNTGRFTSTVILPGDSIFCTVGLSEAGKLSLTASLGFGPFTQTFSNINSFTANEIMGYNDLNYYILNSDGSILDSAIFIKNEAPWLNYQMGNLPVGAKILIVNQYISAPVAGALFVKDISIQPLSPQIDIQPGLTYHLGSDLPFIITIDSLPKNTFQVVAQLIDVNGKVYYSPANTLNNQTSTLFNIDFKSINPPVGTVLNIIVKHNGGLPDGSDYRFPLHIIPQPPVITSSNGWGPFISNNYTYTSTKWSKLPDETTNFAINTLPPKTSKVVFSILDNNAGIINQYIVNQSGSNQYLASAQWQNVVVSNLPPSTSHLEVRLFFEGGQDSGFVNNRNLLIMPQTPLVNTKFDSLAPIVQEKRIRKSLSLKNEGDCAKFLIDSLLNNKTFTIEFWLKLDSSHYNDYMNVIGNFPWLSINHGKVIIGSKINGVIDSLFTNIQFSPGKWGHCAIVYNSPTSYFYYNGNLIYQSDVITSFKNMIEYLGFAEATLSGYKSLKGNIDEFRIWNYCRTQVQIQQNMNSTIKQQTGLSTYWDFDDTRNHGRKIYDMSGNGYDGVLINKATLSPIHAPLDQKIAPITYESSLSGLDSLRYTFFDNSNKIIFDTLVKQPISQYQNVFNFDMTRLSYLTTKLTISSYFSDYPFKVFKQDFPVTIYPPAPTVTPSVNWNDVNYRQEITEHFTYTGFPKNTDSVLISIKDSNNNVMQNRLFKTSNPPYSHSFKFDGNSRIVANNLVTNPQTFSVAMWFKTSSKDGGKLFGLEDTQTGGSAQHDRNLWLDTAGILHFGVYCNSKNIVINSPEKLNDGRWHHVVATCGIPAYRNIPSIQIYIDGSLSDEADSVSAQPFNGYWHIGSGNLQGWSPIAANYSFNGEMSEVTIWNTVIDYYSIYPIMYEDLIPSNHQFLVNYYPLNDSTGTTVLDKKSGNNGAVIGSAIWNKNTKIATLVTEQNLGDLNVGTYKLYTKMYYHGGPTGGYEVQCGSFNIKDKKIQIHDPYATLTTTTLSSTSGFGPIIEGSKGNSQFIVGLGEGTDLTDFQKTYLCWRIDFYHYDSTGTKVYYLGTPVWFKFTDNFGNYTGKGSYNFDMGGLVPGSYLQLTLTWYGNWNYYLSQIDYPLIVEPMNPPGITGNFGPNFVESVAPGSMKQLDTFKINTTADDISKVEVKFLEHSGNLVIDTVAQKIPNSTNWQFVYDMARLRPPQTQMVIEYYLGNDPEPALVEGPYVFDITSNRVQWLEDITDDCFSAVSETSDSIFFSIKTPFKRNMNIDMNIDEFIPFLGGSTCRVTNTGDSLGLGYCKSTYKLNVIGDLNFYEDVFNFATINDKGLDMGNLNPLPINPKVTMADVATFTMDSANGLSLTQNFSYGTMIAIPLNLQDNFAKVTEGIGDLLEGEPVSAEITFSIEGGFKTTSRSNLKPMENGSWGSFGDLDISANKEKNEEKFNNSASFNFTGYDIGLNVELEIAIFGGLIGADFGLDGMYNFGNGTAWVDIPTYSSKDFKSKAIEIDGTLGFSIGLFFFTYHYEWDWVIGRWTVDGDDMTDCFSPEIPVSSVKPLFPDNNKNKSNDVFLDAKTKPVSLFRKKTAPSPEPKIESKNGHSVMTWVENSENGSSSIQLSYFNPATSILGPIKTILSNKNGICNPSADVIDSNLIMLSWTENRVGSDWILDKEKSAKTIIDYLQSQDIWYAVYNTTKDTIEYKSVIEDDFSSSHSGRAEGHSQIKLLSDKQAVIVWKAEDLTLKEHYIYTCMVNKVGNDWISSKPTILTKTEGVNNDIKLEIPEDNNAMVLWLHHPKSGETGPKIEYCYFDGTNWSTTKTIIASEKLTRINYYDFDFENNNGALVFTEVNKDTLKLNTKSKTSLNLISWDKTGKVWKNSKEVLYSTSKSHLTYPTISVNENGQAVVAVTHRLTHPRKLNENASKTDLFSGNLDFIIPWKHTETSNFVCDTNKVIKGMDLAFLSSNRVAALFNEEFWTLSNHADKKPQNGLNIGQIHSNLILRMFKVESDNSISDINENDIINSVDEQPNTELTNSAELYQNYPNPVVDKTKIRFEIPSFNNVRIEIYDLKGNFIGVAFESVLGAGMYETEINTESFRSGTYIYTLIYGDQRASKKMTVYK